MRVGDVTRPDERSPSVASLVRAVTAGGCPGRPVLGGPGRVIRFAAIPRRPLAFDRKYAEGGLPEDAGTMQVEWWGRVRERLEVCQRRLTGVTARGPALISMKNGLAGVPGWGRFLRASDSRGQGGKMHNPRNPASSWDGANLSIDEPFPGRSAHRPIFLAALLPQRGGMAGFVERARLPDVVRPARGHDGESAGVSAARQ